MLDSLTGGVKWKQTLPFRLACVSQRPAPGSCRKEGGLRLASSTVEMEHVSYCHQEALGISHMNCTPCSQVCCELCRPGRSDRMSSVLLTFFVISRHWTESVDLGGNVQSFEEFWTFLCFVCLIVLHMLFQARWFMFGPLFSFPSCWRKEFGAFGE